MRRSCRPGPTRKLGLLPASSRVGHRTFSSVPAVQERSCCVHPAEARVPCTNIRVIPTRAVITSRFIDSIFLGQAAFRNYPWPLNGHGSNHSGYRNYSSFRQFTSCVSVPRAAPQCRPMPAHRRPGACCPVDPKALTLGGNRWIKKSLTLRTEHLSRHLQRSAMEEPG